MEDHWPNARKTVAEESADRNGGPSQAIETMPKAAGDGRLYFCVIDRLSYGSLDTALVHVKMQHGMAFHGEVLLRAKMIGGGR